MVTERPAEYDLPVSGGIGRGQGGQNGERLIGQLVIRRLLGWDLWSDSVNGTSPGPGVSRFIPYSRSLA